MTPQLLQRASDPPSFDQVIESVKAHGVAPLAEDTLHHFSSGVYAKQMRIPAGFVAVSHKHAYDHLSILAQGQVMVRTSAGEKVYVAPAVVTITAGLHHAVHALTDAAWFCVHATDETDPEKVDEVLIERSEA